MVQEVMKRILESYYEPQFGTVRMGSDPREVAIQLYKMSIERGKEDEHDTICV